MPRKRGQCVIWNEPKNRHVHILLTETAHELLKTIAKDRNTSISEVVERYARSYQNMNTETAPMQKHSQNLKIDE